MKRIALLISIALLMSSALVAQDKIVLPTKVVSIEFQQVRGQYAGCYIQADSKKVVTGTMSSCTPSGTMMW